VGSEENRLTSGKNDFVADVVDFYWVLVTQDAKFNADSSGFSDGVGTIKEYTCDRCICQNQEVGAGLENGLQITPD
jgi:hypothetical protein